VVHSESTRLFSLKNFFLTRPSFIAVSSADWWGLRGGLLSGLLKNVEITPCLVLRLTGRGGGDEGCAGPTGSDGVLVEAPPSADFPLNLILYMSFRILAYFDRMDSMLACGTLKKPEFLRKSSSVSERAPDMILTCFTTHPWGPSDLSSYVFNDACCPSAFPFCAC
jgi:hypothetical protein